eukprot:4133086-Pyramimonas_sp.AAC.1
MLSTTASSSDEMGSQRGHDSVADDADGPDDRRLQAAEERAGEGKENRDQAGLYYRKMTGPFRPVSINDAAHAT